MIDQQAQETGIAQRLRRGEPQAFDDFMAWAAGRVYRQALLLLGSAPEAEDAVQEVFVKAHQALPRFTGSRLRAWLATITHHHCLDRLRGGRREMPLPPERLESLSVPASFSTEGNGTDLEDFLRPLTQQEREVVLLRVIDELGYAEIATITGLAEGSLRNILSRGLRKLREPGTAA